MFMGAPPMLMSSPKSPGLWAGTRPCPVLRVLLLLSASAEKTHSIQHYCMTASRILAFRGFSHSILHRLCLCQELLRLYLSKGPRVDHSPQSAL
jgi:hypothetical protein